MKTQVSLDNVLIKKAQAAGGYKTKKAAIEAGLQLVIHLAGQQNARALRGKLHWTGNLDEMRRDN